MLLRQACSPLYLLIFSVMDWVLGVKRVLSLYSKQFRISRLLGIFYIEHIETLNM